MSLPTDEQDLSSLERIIVEATLLFAKHGYHGVSTRAIAKAIGLNISTSNYHVGSTAELYRRVFRRLFVQEFEVLSRFVSYVDDEVVQDPKGPFAHLPPGH